MTTKPSAALSANPGQNHSQLADPVEVQQTLLLLADECSTRMIQDVEQLRRGANTLATAETLHWKIRIGSEIALIVSGPNPVANLLDLTVFVTTARASLEKHWQPNVFG